MTDFVHKFEAAGLGKFPYKFLGMYEAAGHGTSCDYCGTHIRYVYMVGSADSKKFKTGCDCIYRVWAEAPDKWAYIALKEEVQQAEKAFKAKKKHEKVALRIEAAFIKLEEEPKLLTGMAHPNQFLASKGKKMRDYAEWLMVNGGTAGKEKACVMIEKGE